MTRKPTLWSKNPGGRALSRRQAILIGTATAAAAYLPGGAVRLARAQSIQGGNSWFSGEFNSDNIGRLPNYYIASNGNDSNDGLTPTTPWAITSLNDPGKRALYAGTVVGLLDGTYRLYDILGTPKSGEWSGNNRLRVAGGTSGSPTVVVSQTPRGAIIDGQRAAIRAANPTLDWGAGLMGSNGSDYLTFDGLTFTGGHYRFITNYQAVGCNHFSIRNCWLENQSHDFANPKSKNSSMFYSEGYSDILIQNCRFENGNAPDDSDRHACIELYAPSDSIVIEYCTIITEPDGGIAIYNKSHGHTNITYRFNYIDRSTQTNSYAGASILFNGTSDPSDHWNVHHNVLVAGDNRSNIWFDNLGDYRGTASIYNNTFVGDWDSWGNLREIWRGPPTQVNFYNNIIAPTSGGGSYGDAAVASIATIGTMDHNLYPSSVAIRVGDGPTFTSLDSWQSASGADMNSVATDDPLFMASETEAGYYRLAPGSPAKALGAGSTEIGAWSGSSQVGCSFGGGIVLARPAAPELIEVV